MLTLKMTRVSPTHHRFEYVRQDGSGEFADIETKTFLTHDLLHFALESAAERRGGFYGLMAQGFTFEQLNNKAPADFDRKEAMRVEQAVGVFTGMVKNGVSAADGMRVLKNMYDAAHESIPVWLTEQMLDAAAARYRELSG